MARAFTAHCLAGAHAGSSLRIGVRDYQRSNGKGLSQQSRDFLAGDRVLRAAHPVPEAWLQEAKQQGLAVSRQLSF
ncbi:hypothetical protein F1514_006790 [Yersinia pestis]|nr:hypothetical protein [Yersinia pestis]